MKKTALLVILAISPATLAHLAAQETESVHMANGIKIGEVSSTSAIIWTRLTKHPERNIKGTPFINSKQVINSKQDPSLIIYIGICIEAILGLILFMKRKLWVLFSMIGAFLICIGLIFVDDLC